MTEIIFKLIIQLLNGRWLQARELSEGVYEARKADGRVVIYGSDRIRNVEEIDVRLPVPEAEEISNIQQEQKEVLVKPLYHFIEMVDGLIERTITNRLEPERREAYNKSVETRGPVDGIFAIDIGNYLHWALETRLRAFNILFMVKVVDTANTEKARMKELFRKATFAWANSSYTFFVNIDGEPEWGLRVMDIFVDHTKKTGKRLQDVTRITEVAAEFSAYEMAQLDIHVVEQAEWLQWHPDPKAAEILVDGVSFIDEDFLIRVIKRAVKDPQRRRALIRHYTTSRLMWRWDTPAGSWKGDLIPKKNLGHDIVTADVDLKGEVRFDVRSLLYIWPHEAFHVATWDTQSIIDFRSILTEKTHGGGKQAVGWGGVSDLDAFIQNVRKVYTDPKALNWLRHGEPGHNDSGVPVFDNRLAEQYHQVSVRLAAHGIEPETFQNKVYMTLNGVTRKMLKGRQLIEHSDMNTGERWTEVKWNKMWLPMRNAFSGAVITWTAYTKLGGFTPPEGEDGSRVFWVDNIGLVWPDQRFVDTFDLHDGWDQDDTVKCRKILIWTSDPTAPAFLEHWKVLDPELTNIVPTNAEDAIVAAAMIRSPNGPGAYSIESINPFMPWHEPDDASLTVLDLAKAPTPLGYLLQGRPPVSLPAGAPYTGRAMTRAQSWRMILAQRDNPGVGQFVNKLEAYANATDCNLPMTLPGLTSDIIDVLQQGYDRRQFKAIGKSIVDMEKELITLAQANPNLRIDAWVARKCLSAKARRALAGHITKKARFVRFVKAYEDTIELISGEILDMSFNLRQSSRLVRWVKTLDYNNATVKWAREIFNRYTEELRNIDSLYKADSEADPFTRITMERYHSLEMHKVVDKLIAELEAYGDKTDRAVLGLWWFIVNPDACKSAKGLHDRILVQPGTSRSVADLIIEALIAAGQVEVPLGLPTA